MFLYNHRYLYRNPTTKETVMALLKKLVKIANYTGLYLKDDNKLFENMQEVTVVEIQKKIKPPYTIITRFYEGKKAVYVQHHFTNETKTVKRNCDEISAQRQIQQIEKTFKSKDISKTLNQIFDEWIEYRKNSIAPKHYQVTRYCYNSDIKDIIGDIKANNVSTKKIQHIVNALLDRKSVV